MVSFSSMIFERKITLLLLKTKKVWINIQTQFGTYSGLVKGKETKDRVW